MADFQTPDFLQNYSADDVFNTMTEILPADIDLSQGGHAFNMVMPTALIVSQICEFVLPEVIKLIFPEFSYGEYLDYHAQTRGLTRRAATAATGTVTVTGTVGTVIPAGSLFTTPSINEEPSVDYETTEEATIPAGGSVTITVECTQAGLIGNTSANTIVISSSGITGITAVTNDDEITGGTAEETDESLITRIEEYDQSQGDSFVGNVSDYIRWAKSIEGVGSVGVIPAQDTSGQVTIVLTDQNGDPANETLCQAVYDYIMSPDDPESRLAPVNAVVVVEPPETVNIYIKATVELLSGITIEAVSAAFVTQANNYLAEAVEDAEVKYTKLAAVLSSINGVNDFSGFEIGTESEGTVTYGTSNITIESTQLPVITAEDVVFTAGTV